LSKDPNNKTGKVLSDRIRSSMLNLERSGTISVLPDYFIDRFVKIQSIDSLLNAIKTKSSEGGGGSVRGISQQEVKGGNAVNVAYALGKFGARVKLLAIAESLPAQTLRSTFESLRNVELHIVPGRNGLTVALEFFERGRHVNVMLSDTGELAVFDGSEIPTDTLNSITSSKIVVVVNWAANTKGTELCSKIFSQARARGALTFFDPADVAQLSYNIPKLKKEIFDQGLVDYVSLNDNELRILCKVLDKYILPQDYSKEDLQRAIRLFSDQSHATVDVHTRNASFSCRLKDCIVVPCHKVEQKIVTGAGDVWDAADLLGHLLSWDSEQRLRFANAAAGLYVSRDDAEPPRLDDVLNFMTNEGDFY
jgi:ribokinase